MLHRYLSSTKQTQILLGNAQNLYLKSRETITSRAVVKDWTQTKNVCLTAKKVFASISTQTAWSLEPVESYFFMQNSDSVFAVLDPNIAETIR